MKTRLYTTLGECADDGEILGAIADWITASDLCAAASDEDYHKYRPACNAAIERLDKYFTAEAVTALMLNMNELRETVKELFG